MDKENNLGESGLGTRGGLLKVFPGKNSVYPDKKI